MAKLIIKKKIKQFNKVIKVDGDKSLSIRALLLIFFSKFTSLLIITSESIAKSINYKKK